MRKLITLGMLVATVVFGGAAFAGDGGTLQDRELQKLFQWSAQAVESARSMTQTASPAASATNPVPPVLEFRGSEIK